MPLRELIFSALMAVRPFSADAGEPDREARLADVARAITWTVEDDTCTGRSAEPECALAWPGTAEQEAALLVAIAIAESRLSRDIQQGRCKSWQCGSHRVRGVLVPRARSLWQIEPSPLVPVAEWQTLDGPDPEAIDRAARAAARVASYCRRRTGNVRGTLICYAGRSSPWPGLAERLRLYYWALGRLRAGM